ncbi:MAG: hypothetical protein MZU97_01260 [Bacillus subtilis]|nr:hypothetical protein [Bacillus subtilis]
MKKLFLTILLALGIVTSMAFFPLSITPVEASGSQQGLSPVTVELTSYFDPSNIITTTIQNRTYGETLSFDSNLAEQPSGEV